MNRRISIPGVISFDVILLTLLSGAYFAMRSFILLPQVIPHARGIAALMVLVLGVYALLDFLDSGELGRPYFQGIRTALIILAIIVIAVIPTVLAIWMRAITEPHRYVHDGLIQSEAATRFVLAGENPYVEDYGSTPLADWPFREGDLTLHPAYSHYPYLPLTFLLPLPLQWLFEEASGWFDQRIVLLLFFGGTLLLAWGLSERPENQRLLLIAFGLNPLLVLFLIEGRNDIMSLFWILATVRLLQVERKGWSGVSLGLACATKQFSWFFVPFYFAWIVGSGGSGWRTAFYHLKRPFVIFAIVLGSVLLPWLLWDAPAFFEDVLAYQSGASPGKYPIGGFGVGALLLASGVIQPNSAFPFGLLQFALGLPLLLILLSRTRLNGTLQSVMTGYGLWLLAVLFLARSFTDNYLGFVTSIMAAAAFGDREVAGEEKS